MTFKYNNVYVLESSTVAGPYEANGPLENTFDKTFKDLYNGEKTWELAEKKALEDSVEIVLNKSNMKKEDIDLIIAGDLLNQITSSCYASEKYKLPFLGIYSACATSIEGIILGSSIIDSKKANNIIAATISISIYIFYLLIFPIILHYYFVLLHYFQCHSMKFSKYLDYPLCLFQPYFLQ